MALYFVASGGSNTAPYDTWAKAATSLQTALTAATGAGDVVVIQYNAVPSGDAELAADTTYTFGGHVTLLSASADDASTAFTPTAMGTGNWIGNSTTNRFVKFAGNDFRCMVWGLTLRTAGSTGDIIQLNSSSGGDYTFSNCYIWAGNTASGISGGGILLTAGGTAVTCIDCTFRFGATGQYLEWSGLTTIIGGSVSSAGSTPTQLFSQGLSGTRLSAIGFDMSLVTGTLVGNLGVTGQYVFDRCKLGAGVTILASQTTNPTKASPTVLVTDCHSGDTHDFWGYYDALGSVVRDTSIYVTTSDAGAQSWKITTTANANYRTPFRTPWVNLYNTGTSAITPRFEILRDGSATAYKDSEVWGEFAVKNNTGAVTASVVSDAQAIGAFAAGTAGADQAAGTGTGNWTGENATAWSGKVDSGSAVTPAESGYLSGRIAVGLASIAGVLYVEPVIRTT